METTRILIADDHAAFREGMRLLLLSTQDMEVIGEAETGEQAITLAESLQPDVILMDLQMPEVNGDRSDPPYFEHQSAYQHPGHFHV